MRILFVEDEPSQQEVLTVALTAFNCSVVQATDVEGALALLDDPFDAAILDVRLPDTAGLNRDGLTVLGALRARQPEVCVAVFTGVPLTEAEEHFAKSQNATVLYKPQTLDRILDFLTQSLSESALRGTHLSK